MAPRSSTGFARKPPAPPAPVEAARAEPRADPLPEEPQAAEPIPIDLAPLVASYRRNGRLTLRVERLPHRARLSRGQINGDRSFSLTLDDLDGLLYLPPPGGGDLPTLGIRVIRVDSGDATTLAMLDYPVSSDTAASSAVALNDGKEQRRLRDEVVKLKALLAARDSELADVQSTVDKVKGETPQPSADVDVESLRAAWEAEAEERVAEAVRETAARFEKRRGLSEASDAERQAASEKRTQDQIAQERERLRKEADAALKKAEKDWKAAEAARQAESDVAWRKRLDKAVGDVQTQAKSRPIDDTELHKLRDAFAKTKKTLEDRDAELSRERSTATKSRDDVVRQHVQDLECLRGELSKAKAGIEERERQLAQERETAKNARGQTDKQRETEQNRLRDELAKATTALAERDAALARERTSVRQKGDEVEALRSADQERQRLQDELEGLNRLLSERDKDIVRLRADVDADTRSAETKLARLSEELAKARAALSARESELKHVRSGEQQVRAEAENLRSEGMNLKRATAELVSVKASLAVRDAELAQAKDANEEERERWRRGADTALGEARKVFKEGEADRLAAAEAEWRKHSDLAIAEIVTRLHEAEARLREDADQGEKAGTELARLRGDRTALKTQLADRENELLQTKLAQEQARERWKRETEEALQKSQKAWKADETARIAASETLAKDQNTISLNETTARLKHTETLLGEAKAQVETLRHRGDAEDVARLRKDFASVQAQLARREQEVMDLRSDHEIERVRMANEARDKVHRADMQWHEDDPDEAERAQRMQSIRTIVRNASLAIAFAGLAAVGYYKIAPLVSEQASSVLGQNDGVDEPVTPAVPTTAQTVATITKSVNLRDGASTSAKVIGSVPRDTEVLTHEHQGKWIRVEMSGGGKTKPVQGWVYSSYLKDLPAPAKAPSPAKTK